MSHGSNDQLPHGRPVLLCLGSNSYERFKPLCAPEGDVQASYAVVTNEEQGAIPPANRGYCSRRRAMKFWYC